MQEIIYKQEISTQTIDKINKLGGFFSLKNNFEKDRFSFNNQIQYEVNNFELVNYYEKSLNPPLNFLRFSEILLFYYESENKITKTKIDSLIFQYNINLNISFEVFYNNIKKLDEKSLKANYDIGGISKFRILTILIQSYDLNELFENYEADSIFEIPNESLTSIIDEILKTEALFNKNLFQSILRICQNYETAVYFIQNVNFLNLIEINLSELEKMKFRNLINHIVLTVNIFKLGISKNETDNSLNVLTSEIRYLHSKLLDKYAKLIDEIPDKSYLKKTKLKEKLETIIELFNGFERY